MAAIFWAVAPHLGWRYVESRKRKTRSDYAAILRALADEDFPHAQKIVLVQDNLNTHTVSALYETFEAPEAFALAQRFSATL